MNKLSARLALLSLVGGLATVAPAIAAPPGLDCRNPANANNPACLQLHKGPRGKYGPNGASTGANNTTTGTSTQTQVQTNVTPKVYSGTGTRTTEPTYKPRPGGPTFSFNFSTNDRHEFRRRFHGFNFGYFPFQNFAIHLGIIVPHYYHYRLRPVPRSIWRYYPQFRGYLYFVDRAGDFVIVSPVSFRIVAIL